MPCSKIEWQLHESALQCRSFSDPLMLAALHCSKTMQHFWRPSSKI